MRQELAGQIWISKGGEAQPAVGDCGINAPAAGFDGKPGKSTGMFAGHKV